MVTLTILKKRICSFVKWGLPLLCLITAERLVAQTTTQPVYTPVPFPNSPNAASLGKFGDYPVTYYTGLPGISIPVYEIDAGSIKVPISFDYHASGIKITDAASWVGLGWALDAGGQLTRIVKGQPDETYYLNGSMRTASSININNSGDQAYLFNVVNNTTDGEPDIFSFSFPGQSGKFFLNRLNGYQPTMIQYSPVSITYNDSLDFIITDENGNMYFYGDNGEETQNLQNGVSTNVVNAWMLDKIISADKKDTVTFHYSAQYGQTYHDLYDIFILDDDIAHYTENEWPNIWAYSANDAGTPILGETWAYTNQQYLTEIDYKNGKVVFEQSTSNRQDLTSFKSLADIKIYSYDRNANSYTLLKTVVPSLSYFIQGTDASTKRLRLDSLQFNDNSGSAVQKYRFGYNSLALPATTSRQRDLWGYYNGRTNNSLIPKQSVEFDGGADGGGSYNIWVGSSYDSSRVPSSAYNQACMLDTIYYPTGGLTNFEYETNRYLDGSGHTILAGGLRIKAIKSYDGVSSTPITKTFQYDAARSNYKESNYYWLTTETYRYYFQPVDVMGTALNCTKRRRTFLSAPNIDMVPCDATSVVYPQVTEYDGNAASNTGKTVYTFSDYPDLLQSASSVRPVISSYFYRRGHLTGRTVYKNTGGSQYQPVAKEVNTYAAFAESNYGPVGLVAKYNYVDEGTGPTDVNALAQEYLFGDYGIPAGDGYLTSKTTYQYDQFDSTKYTSQTVNYTYGNLTHQQVTKTKTINSKGDTLIHVSKYPADYILSGHTNTGNAVLDSMLVHNLQATAIEQWDSVKSVSGITSLTGVSAGRLTAFKQLSQGIFKPDYTSQLEIAGPVKNFSPSSIVSGALHVDSRYTPMVNFTGYDSYTNIQEYRARNASPMSVIWDYKGTLPVAKVDAASNNQVAYTSFEADGKGNWSFTGTPVADNTAPTGKYAYNLTSHSMTRSGLSSGTTYIVSYWSKINEPYTVSGSTGTVTGKTININGANWTYYEHKVTGVTTETVSGGGEIDEVRLCPASAQMTTYTYDPHIGLTSQCDVNNRITYYEYDDFQRLSVVRDQDRNVIKKICYNYYGQPDACSNKLYYSVAKSGNFTRNNCGTGYDGSTVTYNVAAGAYSAYSQAAADALAQNDVNTNGQAYANSHGTCTVSSGESVSCDNSTSRTWTVEFITGVHTVVASFTVAPGSGGIGSVPAGTYKISISSSGNSTSYYYSIGSGTYTTGISASFLGVDVSSAMNIVISPLD